MVRITEHTILHTILAIVPQPTMAVTGEAGILVMTGDHTTAVGATVVLVVTEAAEMAVEAGANNSNIHYQ